MSCALMYQPYAMSYSSSSSCDRTASAEREKLFRFPHVPSPPDSSNSAGASPPSYPSSHSTLSSTPHHHHHHSSNFTLPLIPSANPLHYPHHQSQPAHPHQFPSILSPHETSPLSQRSSSSSSQSRRSHTPASCTITSEPRSLDLVPHRISSSHHSNSSINSSSSRSSSSSSNDAQDHSAHTHAQSPQRSSRAQYLSANCIVYENYEGDSSREVDEHFTRALEAANAYANSGEKCLAANGGKSGVPMSTRNFPPSFWNSAYQSPAARHYGDFYGGSSTMDYSNGIGVGVGFHHQTDPWHHSPWASHQSYHHHRAAADLAAAAAYNPIPSSSRFNPAQYSSFLFPSTSAAASRFSTGIPQSSSIVKGDNPPSHHHGHWGAGGRYHPHDPSAWSDFHLTDYSAAAAAAAHYSNITAGGNF